MRKKPSFKLEQILLAVIILGGIFLRLAKLDENLFFSYEQGRDLLVVKKISEGSLTLIGPRTSIEGIFHGPFYYYLMLPFYLIFSGNPLGVMTPFILFGAGCIWLSYLVGKTFFNSSVGIIAALLFAVSSEAIVYSRWLSHPPLAIFFTLLLFLSVYKIISGQSKFLILAVFAFALLFQTEIVAALFLLPALLFILFLFKPEIKERKIKIFSFLLGLTLFSPYLLFDFRHQFLMSKSFFRFLSSREEIYRFPIGETLRMIYGRYLDEFSLLVLPERKIFTGVLIVLIFLLLIIKIIKSGWFSKKEVGGKLLFYWLISVPLLGLFFWGGFHLKHYFVGVVPAMILGTAFLIDRLIAKKALRLIGILLLIFLLLSNLSRWRNELLVNREIFYLMTQKASLLGGEKKVIDYIYSEAGEEEFSWQAFAIPYEMEHAWEYLFWQYGKRKYNYLPAHTSNRPGYFYLILEPGGDQAYRLRWIENKIGQEKPIKKAEIDSILVQTYRRK